MRMDNRCQLTRARQPKRSVAPLFRRTAEAAQEQTRRLTAFPALRPLAPERKALTRGKGKPLTAWERQAAMNLALREIHAKSSVGPRRSKLRTILKFLGCFQLPLIPFTVDVVQALGASLKWRGYRSAPLYLYHARAVAEKRGAVVSTATHRALTDMIRSCRRGLGPARQCEGLILEAMPALPGGRQSWASRGPGRPRSSLILGSLWLLREIEFATAEARSMAVNSTLKTASLTLPASKADPSALGETITHGCCCAPVDSSRPSVCGLKAHAHARRICPYHLVLDHMADCQKMFPERFHPGGMPKAGYPLFPTDTGAVCSKEGVTASIRQAAVYLGLPTRDSGGLLLHSGHALRVTGAQALARAGLSENQISLLARWGSTAVLRYIRKAPLASSWKLAARAIAGWHNRDSAATAGVLEQHPQQWTKRSSRTGHQVEVKQSAKKTESRLVALEHSVAELSQWRCNVAASLEANPVAPACAPDAPLPAVVKTPLSPLSFLPFVYSAYGKYHRVVVGNPSPPRLWHTVCGWHFGTVATAECRESLPSCYKLMCDRCFNEERKIAKAEAEHQVSRAGMVPSVPYRLRDW